jgi:hypothetical protein
VRVLVRVHVCDGVPLRPAHVVLPPPLPPHVPGPDGLAGSPPPSRWASRNLQARNVVKLGVNMAALGSAPGSPGAPSTPGDAASPSLPVIASFSPGARSAGGSGFGFGGSSAAAFPAGPATGSAYVVSALVGEAGRTREGDLATAALLQERLVGGGCGGGGGYACVRVCCAGACVRACVCIVHCDNGAAPRPYTCRLFDGRVSLCVWAFVIWARQLWLPCSGDFWARWVVPVRGCDLRTRFVACVNGCHRARPCPDSQERNPSTGLSLASWGPSSSGDGAGGAFAQGHTRTHAVTSSYRPCFPRACVFVAEPSRTQHLCTALTPSPLCT